MFNLALFASGNGTNVQSICEYFQGHKTICPSIVFSDNKKAYVLERAKNLNIKSQYFNYNTTPPKDLINLLQLNKITHIILAGYLRLIPNEITKLYNDKILNIHPSLLPKYGGKGYYGAMVHKSVLEAKENISGISIHLVNEKYDDGKILFQKSIPVLKNDSIDKLSARIHKLEYEFYPQIIEKYLLDKL